MGWAAVARGVTLAGESRCGGGEAEKGGAALAKKMCDNAKESTCARIYSFQSKAPFFRT